jgi:hypothetical protein
MLQLADRTAHRACVAAACRLNASLNYSQAGDDLYKAADLFMWSTTEMTCGFLVFCVPSLPRAMTGPGLTSRVAVFVRTWTNTSSRRQGTEASGISWAQKDASVLGSSGAYNKMDEDGTPLRNYPTSRSEPLTPQKRAEQGEARGGVLGTTHIATHETLTTHAVDKGDYRKEQPWTAP